MRTNLNPFNAACLFYHWCQQKSSGNCNFFLRFFVCFAILAERITPGGDSCENPNMDLILAVVLIACLALSIPLLIPGEAADCAQIISNGKLLYTLDLHIPREIRIDAGDGHYNVVTVKDGAIAVTEATCPDHYCMKRGFCSSGAQIVCLPNRLVIEFVGQQSIDGVAG